MSQSLNVMLELKTEIIWHKINSQIFQELSIRKSQRLHWKCTFAKQINVFRIKQTNKQTKETIFSKFWLFFQMGEDVIIFPPWVEICTEISHFLMTFNCSVNFFIYLVSFLIILSCFLKKSFGNPASLSIWWVFW